MIPGNRNGEWPVRFADLLLDMPPAWADRPAAVAGKNVLTYGELRERATALANTLVRAGAEPGRFVAVSVELGLDLPVAFLATLLTGACCVPIDPELPLPLAQTMCELAGVDVVVGDAGARRLADGRHFVAVEDQIPAGTVSPALPAGPDSAVLCFFTSGSTGQPKGVLHSHDTLLSRQRWEQRHLPLTADDRVLFRTSIGFPVIMRELFWPLMVGACSIFAAPRRTRDPEHLLEIIDRYQVTVTSTSPSLLSLLSQVWRPGRGRSLRLVLSGGEVLTRSLIADFHAKFGQAELHNLYGMTEAPTVTHWHCAPGQDLPAAPAGFPTDMQVSIVDTEGRQCPAGEPGRLVVSGPGVALGYVNDPQTTAASFESVTEGSRATRLFRTGDQARYQPDGSIVFTGRAADHVKVNGYRIDMVATETALCTHPQVRQAAVVVREDTGRQPQLVGYLVPEPAARLRPADLHQYLRGRLAAYSIPARLVFLDELPLGPTGKTDRSALPAPPAEPARREQHESARSRTQQAVLQAFEEVLMTGDLSPETDVFELGLDSLDATRIAVRLKDTHGLAVEVVDIFELSTPRAIADQLDSVREQG